MSEPGASLYAMASARRGHGEDSIYFDQTSGYWVAAVSLGYSADGKRRRRTVRGRTKTEVRDRLRALREEIASNVQSPAACSVRQAIEDWLAAGLDGRSQKTIEKYRYVLKPVAERIGRAVLRDLTAHDVRQVLSDSQSI